MRKIYCDRCDVEIEDMEMIDLLRNEIDETPQLCEDCQEVYDKITADFLAAKNKKKWVL